MANFTYNDLNVACMLLCLARQRNTFREEELAGADKCIASLQDFLTQLRTDLDSRSVFIETLEPQDQ
jgi:hypothetical protein